MYNTSYEEYMRTVLGYMPNCMQDTFNTNDYYIMQTNNNMCNNNCMNDCNLDDLYPDMYKRVYPLVCKECNTNTMPITQESLEQMTDNVLSQIEIDLKIQTNAKVETRKEDIKVTNSRQQETNIRQEDRAPRRNYILRDLIKILILNELINRGRFPGNRPPFPGGPMRPPMPGPRPPFPGGNRPPFSGVTNI